MALASQKSFRRERRRRRREKGKKKGGAEEEGAQRQALSYKMHSPGRLLLLFFASALVLTIAFLYLQPLVDNIQQVTPAMTTDSIADQDLHTLGNEFNALRQIRGHWEVRICFIAPSSLFFSPSLPVAL